MPILGLTNLDLFGNLTLAPKVIGPEFKVSELASTTNAGRVFGFNVSADEQSMIIGAYGSAQASIYAYDGANWILQRTLTKSGRFGFKVAISGDWAAVTNTPTSGNGSVFLYRRVGGVWQTTEHTTINTPSTLIGNGFASSVSLHNDTLVVGHRQANDVGGVHVYVFDGSAWTKQGGLLTTAIGNSRSGANQNLGSEVSVHGDILVAGGPGDTLGKGAGLAFLSKRTGNTWSDPQVMSPPTTYLDGYGWAVKVRGTSVVVGSPYGNSTDQHPGRVFVYDYAGASPVLTDTFTVKTNKSEIIQDTLMKTTDAFGWSIDINPTENVIAVGSIGRNSNVGITYVYEKVNNTWTVSDIPNSWLLPTTPIANGRFGSAVAFTNSGLIVTAYGSTRFYWFK
jgi:hypothetical protein